MNNLLTVEPKNNKVPRHWENVPIIIKGNPIITNLREVDQNLCSTGVGLIISLPPFYLGYPTILNLTQIIRTGKFRALFKSYSQS